MPLGRPRCCPWHSDKARLPIPRTISTAWRDVAAMPQIPLLDTEQQPQRSFANLDQGSAATVQRLCWCPPATRHKWNLIAAGAPSGEPQGGGRPSCWSPPGCRTQSTAGSDCRARQPPAYKSCRLGKLMDQAVRYSRKGGCYVAGCYGGHRAS
uniref:Predicted protein n=1 Tax=Hordeum vulgare subsp. vulgare TaxID=112509 RepID=F2DBQ5_HORVV|nr:predicted protein [Hordeum vulgare subsp. vulgare]